MTSALSDFYQVPTYLNGKSFILKVIALTLFLIVIY